MRIPSLCVLALFMTACSTTRVVDFKYDDVSALLKKRFVSDYDEFEQTKPTVTEKPGDLRLSFESPVNFFYSVKVTLGADRLDVGKTKLATRIIEDHRGFWGYSGRNKKMEKSFLDILEERLKTQKWKRMPWRLKPKDD
ncbi:MAG: hypothetical protein KAG97_13460 [Victivallales bacterium]|nr:hypothetical protein [Victivallales bacterium]